MSKKWNFKSLSKRLKNIKFRKKEEDVPFYLPGDENNRSSSTKPKNSKVESDRFKEGAEKSGNSFLKWLPSFFSTEKRRTVHRTYLILFLFLIFFFLGNFLTLFVVPKLAPKGFKSIPKDVPNFVIKTESRSEWQRRAALLKNKDLFVTAQPNAKKGEKKAVVVNKSEKCEDSDSQTSLPLKLISTFVLQDEVKSLASVQVRGGKESEKVRVGDEIESMALIKKIERLRLVVKNLQNGACEFVGHEQLEKNKSIKPPKVFTPRQQERFEKANVAEMDGIKKNGNKICIKRALIDEKMKNFNELITSARAIPITNPDGTMAFKIVEIVPGSIYSHLDIQNGDVIKAVNGKPLRNANDAMALLGKIKTLPKLSLDLDRSGSAIPMVYSISKDTPSECK